MDTISFVYRQFIDVDILFGYIARNASFWDVEILFGPFLLRVRNYTCLDSTDGSLLMLVVVNSNNTVVALDTWYLRRVSVA
jgi:hypothetical protein